MYHAKSDIFEKKKKTGGIFVKYLLKNGTLVSGERTEKKIFL